MSASASYKPVEADENDGAAADGLEFRSFLGSEQQQAAAAGTDRPVGSAPPAAASRSYIKAEAANASFWSIEYYQKYFDVDTQTVLFRCYRTLLPTEDYLSVVLDSRPDMYGPFWTCTTVVFSLFVFSSLASSITSYLSADPWDYDFKLLSVAMGVVYAYGLGVPATLWAVLRYLGVQEWGLVDAVAVWGYGMTVWIPVSLICLAPVPLLRWAVVGAAFVLSGFFLIRNVYPILALAEAKAVRLLVIVIAILHLAVAITLKVVFFSFYVVPPIGLDDPLGGNSTLPIGGGGNQTDGDANPMTSMLLRR